MKDKRVANVAWPQEANDAVNRTYLYRNYFCKNDAATKAYVDLLVAIKSKPVTLLPPFQNIFSELRLMELPIFKL